MPWMQTTIPLYSDPLAVQEALYAVSMAQAKHRGAVNQRVALFTRDDEEGKASVLLITPEAAEYVAGLPGSWAPAVAPEAFSWILLYSAGATGAELGLRIGSSRG